RFAAKRSPDCAPPSPDSSPQSRPEGPSEACPRNTVRSLDWLYCHVAAELIGRYPCPAVPLAAHPSFSTLRERFLAVARCRQRCRRRLAQRGIAPAAIRTPGRLGAFDGPPVHRVVSGS